MALKKPTDPIVDPTITDTTATDVPQEQTVTESAQRTAQEEAADPGYQSRDFFSEA